MRQNKPLINRVLSGAGLPTLDAPIALVQALAHKIIDHDHFRQVLIACEPEKRLVMYESVCPYLRFQAHPLETYVMKAKEVAEVAQFPTVREDGKFHEYVPHEIKPMLEQPPPEAKPTPEPKPAEGISLARAQRALDQASATGSLTLTCGLCSTFDSFPSMRFRSALLKAREAGWTWNHKTGKDICPACLGTVN